MSVTYRIAPPTMQMFGQDARRDYVGFSEVTFVTREKMNALVRDVFERRATKHYFHCKYRMADGRLWGFEGGKVDGWSSGTHTFDNARIEFTIDRQRFQVPVADITEMSVDYYPTSK